MKSEYSNFKIARENLIKEIKNKFFKKWKGYLISKKTKIIKNNMKFIDKREIKNRNGVNK